jgi:hypothetical protein
MIFFIRCSVYIYRLSLILYPFELRHNFGAEMTAVFTEDLARAYCTRRFLNVLAVWWLAALEILQIALPGRLANRALVAPAVSMCLHLAILGGFLVLATIAKDGLPPGITHGFVTLQPLYTASIPRP